MLHNQDTIFNEKNSIFLTKKLTIINLPNFGNKRIIIFRTLYKICMYDDEENIFRKLLSCTVSGTQLNGIMLTKLILNKLDRDYL